MTEEQNVLFMEWIDKLVEVYKELARLEYIKIEGFSKYAGICIGLRNVIQLDKETFDYALECIKPEKVKTEEVKYEDMEGIRREFKYKDMNILNLHRKGEENV